MIDNMLLSRKSLNGRFTRVRRSQLAPAAVQGMEKTLAVPIADVHE
jgi:hypothetical protein